MVITHNPTTGYLTHKERARLLATQKLLAFNRTYKFNYRRVSVRDQKTRWGSCSKDGNLNFNYKIALLPEHLVDYIVVHELCHLKEFNHSENFWQLVSVCVPEYKKVLSELRKVRFIKS